MCNNKCFKDKNPQVKWLNKVELHKMLTFIQKAIVKHIPDTTPLPQFLNSIRNFP